jgi:transcriptional regulator with XRE-family HTH domain
MYYNNSMTNTATLVRRMRSTSGLSLREMASRASTSAPALSNYETGSHEPRLSTLTRLADAAGCDLVIELRPRLTSADLRTLELHRAICDKFRNNPMQVRDRARINLIKLRSADTEGRSSHYHDRWERLLDGPDEGLIWAFTSSDQAARDLRQSGPFLGVLSGPERAAALQRAHDQSRDLVPAP